MGDDTEWMKLPTDEKCQHKVWKARVAGYEEATKLFHRLDDEKSPEFSKYLGLIKKFVTDSNAIAQEKALDTVLVFLENAASAHKTCGEVMGGIVTKCLNTSRAKTKERAMEIIMTYIEIEKPEVVQEELMKGLDNKQPKVVVACILALREALRDFGSKVIQIKPIVKVIPKLLEDRDKGVREEAKLLTIELYRWIRGAIKPQMAHFKPVQVAELEAEFEKVPAEKAMQCRFMRSQQDLKAKMEEQAVSKAEGGEEGAEEAAEPDEDVDPYDILDPVDILALLAKDYFDKVETKKWQERKEVLDQLLTLSENPKIEGGDFGPLVRSILKVITKDTNVMLVALAIKCLTGIAKGLRKKFSSYAISCISSLLEKFKEKKASVVAVLRDAIDAVYTTTTIDLITEECIAALYNKNPSIRAETALFLARCFSTCSQKTMPKKLLKSYSTIFLKTVNDTTPDVREASFKALGTAMKVVTEKNIAPYLTEVDNIKMQKIKDCCESAVLLNARGEPRQVAAAAKPVTSEPKPVTRPPPAAAVKKEAPAKKKPPTSAAGGKKKAAGKKPGGATAVKEEREENALSDEIVFDKMVALVSEETLTQLASSNWKERLAAMTTLTDTFKGLGKAEIPTQACVRTLVKKPGLKDNNFQVLKLRLDLLAFLAQNSSFSKRSAEFCIAELVDKIGDVKNGASAQEALSCISEATSLDYTSLEVIKQAFEQKNPKNQSEALNWLAKAVTEFGFKINIKMMLEYIKKAFAATNPAIRTAAISLLSIVYLYMGANLRMFFDGEKAALLQQIDAEFEKVKGQKPPAPIRGQEAAGEGDDDADDDDDDADKESDGPNIMDILPRNDIGDKITPELLTEMADKNWKVRGESLQKVIAILNEAKFISGNIGQLPDALKARLVDSNKILVTTTIGICLQLAQAMGPHCKHHVKTLGPALITCMGDPKAHIRAAAVAAMNAWVEQTTLTPLVEAEAFSDALKLEQPNLRIELLGWLTERLPSHKTLPTEFKTCIPHILACLEDRNGDVRKKAQDALVPFMIHCTYESFYKAAAKVKPSSKDQIVSIIEKVKGSLPVKAPKTKKARPATAKPTPQVDRSEDEEELPRPQTAPEPSKTVKGGSRAAVRKGKTAAPAASKKKEDVVDTSPFMNLTSSKENRMKDEKNLKVLKWNFTEPRPEFVDQLRLQMDRNFNKALLDQMFHSDFKQQMKGIEALIKSLESLKDETLGNLDLILRWMTLRFFETNPSVLMKALEYLQKLFVVMSERECHLTEYEATAFMPYLIIKVGEPKDNIRRDVRTLFKLICKVYPASKMFSYLIEGLRSKNSKQRTECLEELGLLIDAYGINICQPSPAQAIKAITSQIGDRDKFVRSAALNTACSAYQILGDGIYNYTKALNDKDQSLLDERIKRFAKSKPPPKNVLEEKQAKNQSQMSKATSQHSFSKPASGEAIIPKSESSNSVKKMFTLDIDTTVEEVTELQLEKPDIEDLFEPVQMPVTRPKPATSSMKMISNSQDAAAVVSLVISQISGTDVTTSIKALAQIDEVLSDSAKAEVLTSHIDHLVLMISVRFKMAFSSDMSNENVSQTDVVRLYRSLLGTIIAIFQNKSFAKLVSKQVLKDTINSMVTILLDTRLDMIGEGTQVIRSINVAIVRIVSMADSTNTISALIRLLHDCVAGETFSIKFQEIVMKCLWKVVRMLPDIINDLNIEGILYDAHLFLKAFPTSTWKAKPSDLPLRTLKTILHSLVKLKGNKILNHTSQIESENSEVLAYMQKILSTGNNNQGGLTQRNGTDDSPKTTTNVSSKSSARLSKSTHDMLAEIFKKIGSRDYTKEGMNELYDFKLKHPDADLNPFLKKSSEFFQSYIETELKSIDEERNRKSFTSYSPDSAVRSGNIPASTGSTGGLPPSEGGGVSKNDVYWEQLKRLRAKCGLDAKTPEEPDPVKTEELDTDVTITTKLAPVSNVERLVSPSDDPPVTTTTAQPADFLDLKKRLDRIKKLAQS